MDATTNEITTRADESDESRRKLIELSREFRKNTNEVGGSIILPLSALFTGVRFSHAVLQRDNAPVGVQLTCPVDLLANKGQFPLSAN